MPLVLTTNDMVRNPEHLWDDIEGVQYHYPNQYKSKIQPGVEFVYYRGVHRKDGSRAPAEYFGRGRIGAVRPDPSTEGASRPSWFCAIEDYQPFNPPVPAKIDDAPLEQIAPNMWRNGVRDLDEEIFRRIVERAAQSSGNSTTGAAPSAAIEVDNLIAPSAKITGGGKTRGDYRRSKRSKEIGDWAERAVLDFIRDELGGTDIVHRAGIRETPGWDIDYRDAEGVLQRVEVKGHRRRRFHWARHHDWRT